MANLLVVALSDPARDPRPNRMMRLLKDEHAVTFWGLAAAPWPEVTSVPLQKKTSNAPGRLAAAIRLLAGNPRRFFERTLTPASRKAISQQTPDAIICHDLQPVPYLLQQFPNTPLLVDLREFYPREQEEKWLWRTTWGRHYHRISRTYLPQATACWTVSPGLKDAYQDTYGVSCEVVLSLPEPVAVKPTPVDDKRIRIIHHGVANADRNITDMMDAVTAADERFHLDLMLVPQDEAELARIQTHAANHPRIHIRDPVPMPQIIQELNQYDIGLFLCPPTNFNVQHILPNKLFEFIQARLAVAVGPSPEMEPIIQQYGIGVVAPDFQPQSMAATLNTLDGKTIRQLKQRSHKAAAVLNHEKNARLMKQLLAPLLKTRPSKRS